MYYLVCTVAEGFRAGNKISLVQTLHQTVRAISLKIHARLIPAPDRGKGFDKDDLTAGGIRIVSHRTGVGKVQFCR